MGDRRPAMQSLVSKYRLICIAMGSIELTDPQDIDTEQLEYCGNWTTDGHWLLLPASQALVATVDITAQPHRGDLCTARPSQRNPENCRKRLFSVAKDVAVLAEYHPIVESSSMAYLFGWALPIIVEGSCSMFKGLIPCCKIHHETFLCIVQQVM